MSKYVVHDFIIADRQIVASGKSYSFRAYTDRIGKFGNPGATVFFDDGTKDKQNRPIGKGFSVGQSHYKLQAREGQKDNEDKTLFDFFTYAPFCEGSPNGDYYDADGTPLSLDFVKDRKKNIEKLRSGEIKQINVKIKVLDDESDAELALETGLKRSEAQLNVGSLDEETLSEIAAHIGEFGKPDKRMRLKVYEYAGKMPIDYFKILNAGDRGLRALVRKGLAEGVLTQKGTIIYWNETVMGSDENSAVKYLIDNPDAQKTLGENLNLKIDKKSKPKK
jgi:hypothetical protein